MTEHVRISTTDRVTHVVLARPEKKNAITQAMYGSMAQAIREYSAGDDARALVITGEGDYFTDQGWRFEVVDMDGRRIDKLLVSSETSEKLGA